MKKPQIHPAILLYVLASGCVNTDVNPKNDNFVPSIIEISTCSQIHDGDYDDGVFYYKQKEHPFSEEQRLRLLAHLAPTKLDSQDVPSAEVSGRQIWRLEGNVGFLLAVFVNYMDCILVYECSKKNSTTYKTTPKHKLVAVLQLKE